MVQGGKEGGPVALPVPGVMGGWGWGEGRTRYSNRLKEPEDTARQQA